MNSYGIYEKSFQLLLDEIKSAEKVFEAKIFGSRAMGNFKKGSDIDIAIFGEKINYNDILKLSTKLNEELPIPYRIDIVQYDKIDNKELKNHIDLLGKTIYKKSN